MKNKLNLVVVCENFGTSFSGGSTATACLINEMQNDFSAITIICQKSDGYLNKALDFIFYENESEITTLLKKFPINNTIVYGDFYKCHEVVRTDFPCYFTYHDNWPEMQNWTTDQEVIKNILTKYSQIFQHANKVFSVSNYKLPFIQEYTDQVVVARNGLSQKITKTAIDKYSSGDLKILMLGNIGFRKYGKAIELFKLLDEQKLPIQIDIFGNVNDAAILDQLTQFDFVNFKGFKKEVTYNGYQLLLQTSVIENMPLSIVDSIANHTPVISFDVGGVSEIITNENGRIIPAFDIQKMAAAIQELIQKFQNFTFDSNKLKPYNWANTAQQMVNIINTDVQQLQILKPKSIN